MVNKANEWTCRQGSITFLELNILVILNLRCKIKLARTTLKDTMHKFTANYKLSISLCLFEIHLIYNTWVEVHNLIKKMLYNEINLVPVVAKFFFLTTSLFWGLFISIWLFNFLECVISIKGILTFKIRLTLSNK